VCLGGGGGGILNRSVWGLTIASVLNLEPAFPLRLLHSVEDKRLKETRIGITGSELLKEPGPDGGCRNAEDFLYMLFFYCRTEYLIGTHSCNIPAVGGIQQWSLFWLRVCNDYGFKDADAILMWNPSNITVTSVCWNLSGKSVTRTLMFLKWYT